MRIKFGDLVTSRDDGAERLCSVANVLDYQKCDILPAITVHRIHLGKVLTSSERNIGTRYTFNGSAPTAKESDALSGFEQKKLAREEWREVMLEVLQKIGPTFTPRDILNAARDMGYEFKVYMATNKINHSLKMMLDAGEVVITSPNRGPVPMLYQATEKLSHPLTKGITKAAE